MVGVRIGFSIAFVSVIISELFAARQGLGLLVQRAYGLQRFDEMFAVVLLIFILAFAGNLALWYFERRMRSKLS
jgi:NitT/TauT family transport system permease protein